MRSTALIVTLSMAMAGLAVAEASAHEITVDSGKWKGLWRIVGSNRTVTRDRNLPKKEKINLDSGNYWLYPTLNADRSQFNVAANGTVSSLDAKRTATFRRTTITFNTFTAQVDAGKYEGMWRVHYGEMRPRGVLRPVSPVTLVRDAQFMFHFANGRGTNFVTLRVAADRTLSVRGTTAASVRSGTTLVLHSVGVVLDSQAIGRVSWRFRYGATRRMTNWCAEEVVLVRDTVHRLKHGAYEAEIELDANGNVTNVTGAAQRRGSRLVALYRPAAFVSGRRCRPYFRCR